MTAYDSGPVHDNVRKNIAYWLIAGLLAVIAVYCVVGVAGAVGCASSTDCDRLEKAYAIVRDFLAVALASITGLVGAVTGFYFGAHAAKKV